MAFLQFPAPIRKIISTTDAIECLNARYRRSVNACGRFPNEMTLLANWSGSAGSESSALKALCLTTLAPDPTGRGRKR